jgi:glycosyltransferase involved in cell wall biosynthesis
VKKLLYIAYYFPPAGGPGVQRSLKFARYLPDHGWSPTVVTVDPAHAAWPALDESMLQEVPSAVRVVRTRSRDPYAAYARLRGQKKSESVGVGFADDATPGAFEKLARFVRANLFLPDARVGWVRFAKRAVKRLLEEESFDAILTSGPPHSSHLVGRWASKQFGLPWLADFRDPWTEVSYYDQLPFLPWSRAIDRHYEGRVLRDADSVITVSRAVAELLRAKSQRDVAVIPNGFDPSDLQGIEPLRGEGFRLVHTGTITESQNPTGVWKAVRAMRDTGADIRVHLVGRVDASVRQSLESAGLGDALDLTPYVPHREALGYMAGADCLLMSVPRTREAAGILTGKVFEYLASGPAILATGPVESDPARLIREGDAGEMFDYDDVAGIAQFLDAQYTSSTRPAAGRSDYLAPFTRQKLSGELANELNRIAT